MFDLGVLILRLVVGLSFMGHGGQKLFGWFGGHGLKGTSGWLESLGLRPAWFWGLVAALSEFGGGLLLLLGFLNPLGSLGIIAAMLVATIQVHWANGFWNSNGGYEFPLTLLTIALSLALTGSGKYSLDAFLGIDFSTPQVLVGGLVLVVLGVVASQVTRSKKTA